MGEFENVVEAVRGGRATFEEFEAVTRERWAATARWLMYRISTPGWVEPRDVVQDLMAGAWSAIWGYEPGKGDMPLGRYVRVMAVNEARRALNRARGCDRHTGAGPSHIDCTFSRLGEAGEEAALNRMQAPAGQEEALARKRRLREMCRTLEEVIVLQALDIERTFEGAAARVYGDQGSRDLLGIEDERHAARVVVRAAYAVAIRIENAA